MNHLKKNIKLRIEVAEDPQKHIFKFNFRFWVLSCIAIGKIDFFFQKAETFSHRVTSRHFFLRSVILTKNDLKKTRFSQVVATGQDSLYKSCSLAASWRNVGTQCYRSYNIISYWVSHRHTILYQRIDPWHQTGSLRVSSRRILAAVEPRKQWRQVDRV